LPCARPSPTWVRRRPIKGRRLGFHPNCLHSGPPPPSSVDVRPPPSTHCCRLRNTTKSPPRPPYSSFMVDPSPAMEAGRRGARPFPCDLRSSRPSPQVEAQQIRSSSAIRAPLSGERPPPPAMRER
jgi:hypothetical protein